MYKMTSCIKLYQVIPKMILKLKNGPNVKMI